MEENKLLKDYENKENIKKSINKVLLSGLVYTIIFNLFAGFLSTLTKEVGILHLVVVILSIISIYFIFWKKENFKVFEVKRKFTVIDFIYFAGLIYIFSLLFALFSRYLMDVFNIKSINVTLNIQKSLTIALSLYVAIIGPIAEEIQYRGFYLSHIRKHGAWLSIILSTVVFSFAHLNFIQGVGTLGIGLILGYIAYFYSLKAAIIMHIWNNTIVLVAGLINPMTNTSDQLNLDNLDDYVGLAVFSFAALGLMLFSFFSSFTKKRREQFSNDLRITEDEKSGIKLLFSNIFFIGYLLFAIIINIVIGSPTS